MTASNTITMTSTMATPAIMSCVTFTSQSWRAEL